MRISLCVTALLALTLVFGCNRSPDDKGKHNHGAHDHGSHDHGSKTPPPPGVEQTTCPVSDETIDGKIFVKHDGQKVYLCCADCKAQFLKEPQKYMAKLGKKGKGEASSEHAH